jgi:hypothetical protein
VSGETQKGSDRVDAPIRADFKHGATTHFVIQVLDATLVHSTRSAFAAPVFAASLNLELTARTNGALLRHPGIN